MHEDTLNPRHWSTSSFGIPADTSPMELDELGRHLQVCRLGGRGATLQCALQAARSFVAARLVTSVAVAGLVVAVTWLVA